MKHLKIGTIGMLFMAMLFSVNTFAQRGIGNGQGYYCDNIPNLTADQQTEITTLRTAHWKQMQINRNQLEIKRANLQTLRSAGNVDINEINKSVDEMGVIRTNIQKNKEQHIQYVRNVLNDEQKVYFDKFYRGKGNCQAYNGRKGRRNGQANGRGNGRYRGGF